MLVDIPLTVEGRRLSDLHIRLRGEPNAGGGVDMTSSRVTFGPAGNPDQYSGRVTALAGTNIEASVAGPVGSSYVLVARMSIEPGSSTVTGTLTAQAGSR
jgi:hypothetical protein